MKTKNKIRNTNANFEKIIFCCLNCCLSKITNTNLKNFKTMQY
ncbi:hypothetical protein QN326_05250 [Candidatus Phytoplasma asteris]|uniref:Uncharacterized protein n=1 Tax=Candidatus Phytoplasma asteris TaxID=85620 RepID=A0ABZ3CGM1_9MOLU